MNIVYNEVPPPPHLLESSGHGAEFGLQIKGLSWVSSLHQRFSQPDLWGEGKIFQG